VASPTWGGGAGTPVRRPPLLRRMAGQSSTPSLPGVWRLELFVLKLCEGIGDTHPRFNHGGNDPLAPRMGSQASSFSPQDPPPVQLLREAVNWCLRYPLRVLGFDLKWAEIWALWPPIYRGFILISKRIRSQSCFEPSIKLVCMLVMITPKGKAPSMIRVWDELDRAADPGSVTPSQLGSARPTGGLLGHVRWKSFGSLRGLRTGE
jgi:hypothetical protein